MLPNIFFSQHKQKTNTRMSSRNRPLHACGVSIFAIADITFGKSQEIKGPLGNTLRKIAKLTKFLIPLIYTMQYQFLAILSFMDDRVLFLEKIAEKLFPPSKFLFDKIDNLVLVILSLPETFEDVINKLPSINHDFPFLELALTRAITELNGLVSKLKHWGMENSRVVNEKTIGVDRNCSEESESEYVPMDSNIHSESMESFPPISEIECKGVNEMGVSNQMKGSYKEALLEKCEGREEDDENDEECESVMKCQDEKSEGKEVEGDGNNEEECENLEKYQVGKSEGNKDDPLLELFESAWLMKPGHH